MPYLETPDELAEAIADLMGVYGTHSDPERDCLDLRRACRSCYVTQIAERIRQSVKNENLINHPPFAPDVPEGEE